MIVFFQCVAEAVAEKGVRGAIEAAVPGSGWMFDIAKSTWEKYRQRCKDAKQREEIQKLAQASFEEAKKAAAEAVKEYAAKQPEIVPTLEVFLAQIPGSIRQSLKRADDPTGTTVPATFALRGPEDVAKLLPPALPRFKPGDPLPGKAGWLLEKQLGIGGFGEVWLARKSGYESLLGAVKFCRSLDTRDRDLLHESKVIDQLLKHGDHPNIVKLMDVHLEGDAPWLMYEYVEGGDLTDLIHQWSALPPSDRQQKALAALQELAVAIGHFHRLDPVIVHRDLKPANILRDKSGRLRITDFGISGIAAKHMIENETRGVTTRAGRLQSYLYGSYTPLYASPQQKDGAAPDIRDDVHALGVIGYQMLTGRITRGPGTDFAIDLKDAAVEESLAELLGQCASAEPRRRPRDAVEMAERLSRHEVLDGTILQTVDTDQLKATTSAPTISGHQSSQIKQVKTVAPSTIIAKRPNVAIPKLPPGLALTPQGQILDVRLTPQSCGELHWLVENGAQIAMNTKVAEVWFPDLRGWDGDWRRPRTPPNGFALAPASGILTHLCRQGSLVGRNARGNEVWKVGSMLVVPDGADWSVGKVSQPPQPKITLVRSGDGLVYPGDHAWICFTIENSGRGDLVQVNAVFRSSHPVLSGWQTMVGRVKPGQKVERCFAAILPTDSSPGKLRGELAFSEVNGVRIPPLPIVFTVHPLPRPDFTARWTVFNDGSGHSQGSGDGKPKAGEYIDIGVVVHNQTGEDLGPLSIVLHPRRLPNGVRITAPRYELGAIKDEAKAEGRVSFDIDGGSNGLWTMILNALGGKTRAIFELRIESSDGRAFAVETIELAIEQS